MDRVWTWEERCLSAEMLSEAAEGEEQKELLLGPIRFDLETSREALEKGFPVGLPPPPGSPSEVPILTLASR